MRFIIAGFGKFGRIAFQRLQEEFPHAEFVIMENDPKKVSDIGRQARVMNVDAPKALVGSSLEDKDIVIPMVPFNLAASFVTEILPDYIECRLPDDLADMVPNPFVMNKSNLFASQADFMCPDDCPEGDLCTVTGKQRVPLYTIIENLEVPENVVLVRRSFQILPGVGGYKVEDLKKSANEVRGERVVIATCCKCHGVLTALRRT